MFLSEARSESGTLRLIKDAFVLDRQLMNKPTISRKSLVLFAMWIYLCKSAMGVQMSEKYHIYDILVNPRAVIEDIMTNFLYL
jgi:hypothetical protein